ncbi:hypothetical protein F3J23_18705 [Chryseobacterium sp. Tr-659]|uniref:hypothetical protein n=1 Tax=Chryseobacterium sp. Tr-659 TaxID=2608340 RepID=UPI00142316FC|nr:hypothetical protein [Chryseobacterium sp. Tr-659]NIF07455.1 hypothetical protein [Chryseobacterium sp. Tr-659]
MKKRIIALLALFIFNEVFTQVGINTASPTQTLDVNGTTRLRGVPGLVNPPASSPTGTNPVVVDNNNFPNVLVNRTDGTVGSRSFLQLKSDVRAWTISSVGSAANSNINLSAVEAKDLADMYVVGSGSHITLPTCSSGAINGKIFTAFLSGAISANPVVITATPAGNIFNAADPAGSYTPPAGIVYNNSGGNNGTGNTISISLASNVNTLRFTIIRLVCIGAPNNKWFFDHNVE